MLKKSIRSARRRVAEKSDDEAFWRKVEAVYPSQETFKAALRSKRNLSIYWGIDPTGPDLHLGHSTNLLVLRHLQKLGKRVIILIGDFTARIGDPSGKDKKRIPLTKVQVRNNMKAYKSQILKLLDPQKTAFRRNSEWWDLMSAQKLLELDSFFTYQQLIERDMFQRRIKSGKPISIQELQYPLLQGYDSVALQVDGEIGATDQLFNMMRGRDMTKLLLGKDKFVLTTPLLVNPKTGGQLMSKTSGRYVALDAAPFEMYGKIMALPDETIIDCFKFCTDVSGEEILIKKQALVSGGNPRDVKAELAYEIVKMYYGDRKATLAARKFKSVFQRKELPQRVPKIFIAKDQILIDVLVTAAAAKSKGEARRLFDQGAVEYEGTKIRDYRKTVGEGGVVKVGKHTFIKIVVR